MKTTTIPTLGSCTLVGAGPGDPELLTLKAVKAIQAATVLLVDDLVNEEVLAWARPEARIVHVGKRGGCKSTPQAFIEKLMVTAVREGEHVVRLKGGDPFIFGRGGEEVEHLRAEGIACQVVNGITAGLAATTAMGVPLTHRDHAQGTVLLTGHAKPGQDATDWQQVGAMAHTLRLTLVIYMGVSNVERIAQQLQQAMPGATPVAIIQNATRPSQRHVVTTLDALARTMLNTGMGSPSVIVVGDVLLQAMTLPAELPDLIAQEKRRQG
ncbi:uroporphyrinogen-III C-methyltransferase [Pseudorhodoferax sp. Leaf274]|uniref:uroporphyrinogen-III C-methyltransferase n=1 Tax=Pseudorhodoferax sp. Leaf274 TaxID=1736318 RepID=UPI0007033069|nr:uroporphyrinogen-III C-methyltransferase [Pseudorhodoferax sp. Leaf274]KQP47504.1 uroporphyrin-III methyltransferase [Pseudorhodoferax sp. Leaf274]